MRSVGAKNFFGTFAALCSKFLRSLLILLAGPTPNSEEPQLLTAALWLLSGLSSN